MRGQAYFSPAQVERIRVRIANGETQMAVALDLGVEQATIGYIARGETYRNCPGPITKHGRKRARLPTV